MQMVYNSDAFAVVEIEVPAHGAASSTSSASSSTSSASSSTSSASSTPAPGSPVPSGLPAAASPSPDEPGRAAFEIVDKMARTDIFLTGDIARQFREGVEALARDDSTPDQIDEFISRYTGLPQQPLILH